MAVTERNESRSVEDTLSPGSVVTPEGVVLEFQLAGVASRALAACIDAVIQFLVMLAAILIGAAIGAASEIAALIVVLVSIIAVLFGYPVAMEVLNNGKTVGRLALGTRVVTVSGAPVGFRQALIRAFLAIVDSWMTFGGIAMICALLTPRGQRLGDLAAGTMMVRERSASSATEQVWYRTAVNPATINASRIDPALYNEIRAFLLRADGLSDSSRHAIGTRLVNLTLAATGFGSSPPPNVDATAWLSSVAAAASGQLGKAPPPGSTVTVVGWSGSSSTDGAPPPPPIPGTGVGAQRGPRPLPTVETVGVVRDTSRGSAPPAPPLP